MNLKDSVFYTFHCNPTMDSDDCDNCPYRWENLNKRFKGVYRKSSYNCLEGRIIDFTDLILAYEFALIQYKETLEELIENNDGDVKEICVFLLNLLRIKEVDIEKGFYI